MPRATYPPTPGSSSDIKGQDGSQKLASLQLSFELPPPALHDTSPSSASRPAAAAPAAPAPAPANATDLKRSSPPSPPVSAYPMQAAEAVKARRRSSNAAAAAAAAAAAQGGKESSFTLPPPPTRSRKIIQMKPPQEDIAGSSTGNSTRGTKDTAKGKGRSGSGAGATTSGTKATANAQGAASAAAAVDSQQGKKKQPSATSAAGRKIARKTAHSLIERRRRSKMNEEFALLKSMIPACTGEMHKLAILQASIEYVRYLEDCVSKLKAQHDDSQNRANSQAQLPSIHEFHPTFRDDGADVEMTDSEAAVSPTFTAMPDHMHSRQPSVSPALHPQDARSRQQSYSSVSTEYRHHSYSASANTSPAFGPQLHGGYVPAGLGSALTSPALNPQSDLDHEATAALLMLNNDRRAYDAGNGSRRSVSVRDLLTT